MTQKQKDLLLKDLCARLPYGVKVLYDNQVKELQYIEAVYNEVKLLDSTMNYTVDIEEVKPYIFPLSSMSEDQKYEFYLKFFTNDYDFDYFKFYLDNGRLHKLLTSLLAVEEIIDWFHKNHIDYRGLIPTGLAEDATGKNIY